MRYIEQLLKNDKKSKLWQYIPFTVFFLGIMLGNWLIVKLFKTSTNDLISKRIAEVGKNMNFLEMIVPFAFLLLFLIIWVLFVHKQSLLSLTTSRNKVDIKRFVFSFGLWTAVIVLGFIYSYWTEPENYIFAFDARSFFIFLLIAVIFVPIQTSFEEYFMRAYLMQGIGLATRSRAVSLFATSIIFGLMHSANPEVEQMGWSIMIYYIGTGFFLGVITLMDEGIELALGFHAANNLIGALLVTSNWTAFQTNSLFIDITPVENISISSLFVQVLIFLPLLTFIFARVYGWKNWSQHLFGSIKKGN